MEQFLSTLKMIGLIIAVIAMFNITIYVHELGHFLAARWRGVYVDRFQIWFGKPIWKKKVNGVQYSLGWIPAGGFVSLPQMVSMESVEGEALGSDPLPPIKPLDKIIVAAAGPIFSFLLAVTFALVVWKAGKPVDMLETTTIGYVAKDSPAEKAGLLEGDEILEIDGVKMEAFAGNFQSVVESIRLSEDPKIQFLVKREGVAEPILIESDFEIPGHSWWERSGLRRVGIWYSGPAIVESLHKNSPAAKAGFKRGDIVTHVNGQKIYSRPSIGDLTQANEDKPMVFTVQRGEESLDLTVTPVRPKQPENSGPKVGIAWNPKDGILNESVAWPNPWTQITGSLEMMWVTITKVLAPGSSVKVQHLNGPVGIAKAKYDLLKTDNGWRRVLWFMVFFNINLGILNLLPLPILDGGHITMAILEKIKGSPLNPRILGTIQMGFAVILIGFMLFVTSKDLGSFIPGFESKKSEKVIF